MSVNDKWTCLNGEIVHQVTLAKLWHRKRKRAVTLRTGETRAWKIWKSTSDSKAIFGLPDGGDMLYLTMVQRKAKSGTKEVAGVTTGEEPSNDTPYDDERAFECVRSSLAPSRHLLRHSASGRYLCCGKDGKIHFTDHESVADDWGIEM